MIPNKKTVTPIGVTTEDVYSSEFGRRRIYLTDTITDQTAAAINAQIRCLAAESKDDIWMIIQSGGGSVSAGMSILDTMNTCGCDICTVVDGMAASMAAFLATCGTRRYIGENAEMMIHQPLGGVSGQASDIERSAEHILRVKKRLYKILALKTGQSYNKIADDCDRDYFLDAQEAIAYGLADEIFRGFDT